MRKLNQYRTTYYKEIAAFITVLFVGFVVVANGYVDTVDERTYVRVETENHTVVEVSSPEPVKVTLVGKDLIIQKIKENFPRNPDVMVAIAKAESHLNPNAVGYNCYYNKDETIVYTTKVKGAHSTRCKQEHQKYSWSIDCNLLQKNYIGLKKCPEVSIDEHLEEVANLSRVQGLEAWAVYNSGAYLKYLK